MNFASMRILLHKFTSHRVHSHPCIHVHPFMFCISVVRCSDLHVSCVGVCACARCRLLSNGSAGLMPCQSSWTQLTEASEVSRTGLLLFWARTCSRSATTTTALPLNPKPPPHAVPCEWQIHHSALQGVLGVLSHPSRRHPAR